MSTFHCATRPRRGRSHDQAHRHWALLGLARGATITLLFQLPDRCWPSTAPRGAVCQFPKLWPAAAGNRPDARQRPPPGTVRPGFTPRASFFAPTGNPAHPAASLRRRPLRHNTTSGGVIYARVPRPVVDTSDGPSFCADRRAAERAHNENTAQERAHWAAQSNHEKSPLG